MRGLRQAFIVLVGLPLVVFLMGTCVKPVVAQDVPEISVVPGEITVPLGTELVLELEVIGGNDINAFDVTIYYNDPVLSLLKWEHGDYLSNLAIMMVVNEPGILQVAATQVATPAVSGDGVLLKLYFRAESVGSTAVEINEAVFANPQGIKAYPELVDGIVSVANLPSYTPTVTPTGSTTPTVGPTFTPSPSPTATIPQPTATFTQLPPTATAPQPSATFPSIPTVTPTTGIDIEATEMAEAYRIRQLSATVSVAEVTEAATMAQVETREVEQTPLPTKTTAIVAEELPQSTAGLESDYEDDEGEERFLNESAQSARWEWILWGALTVGVVVIVMMFLLIIRRKKRKSESYLL